MVGVLKTKEGNAVSFSDIPLDSEKFAKILLSSRSKAFFGDEESNDAYVFIHAKRHNREIFKMLSPLLNTFSRRMKDIFETDGCIITRGPILEAMICKNADIRTIKKQYLCVEYDYS
jgi:hypothetical protein